MGRDGLTSGSPEIFQFPGMSLVVHDPQFK